METVEDKMLILYVRRLNWLARQLGFVGCQVNTKGAQEEFDALKFEFLQLDRRIRRRLDWE